MNQAKGCRVDRVGLLYYRDSCTADCVRMTFKKCCWQHPILEASVDNMTMMQLVRRTAIHNAFCWYGMEMGWKGWL